MKLVVYAEPATEPVTLTEAKAHLRVTSTADDTYLTSLITAARMRAEQYTRRAFITQTLELSLDDEPAGRRIDLPRAPLVSVTSVTAYSDADAATVFAATNYNVDTRGEPGGVVLKADGSWPSSGASLRTVNQLVVRYVAGYGAAAAVPEAIKLGIKEIMATMYDREVLDSQGLGGMARMHLAPYRLVRC